MHNLVDAARGGLLAYGTVYAGLESSAKVLGKSVRDNTVKVRGFYELWKMNQTCIIKNG
jgi:hypothetical protein